jgi:hypothetical protein
VEDQQIVQRRAGIADRAREVMGALNREAAAGQRDIEGALAGAESPRRRMGDRLAEPEILEEEAGVDF